MKHYWLMKSEPEEVSVNDVLAEKNATTSWFGVRNYQARNFMRDQMQIGDGVLFYHSSCAEPGIVGIAEIASAAYPDQTQFEEGKYFEVKSTREQPRWMAIDVKVLYKTELINLNTLRQHMVLADMVVLRRGNRLSISPVRKEEWEYIVHHLIKGTR